MATSSERSPPPFPDSEDQELETEEVRVNDSDDDGEDIFLNTVCVCLKLNKFMLTRYWCLNILAS